MTDVHTNVAFASACSHHTVFVERGVHITPSPTGANRCNAMSLHMRIVRVANGTHASEIDSHAVGSVVRRER